MQDAAWMKLLRHIPASDQSKLMLVTTSGTEITIQCILRIDPECLALRGRLSGSTDAGRVFFVPYSHIDYFGFQQPLKESEFHELFGSLAALTADSLPEEMSAPQAVAPEPAPVKANLTPTRGPTVIKSAVLEKFRARSVSNPGTQMRPPQGE
ncbi:MAG TPA: hypothetical protein VE999_00535 [Gemmataceae bacterium]|nr:hypothetical protein [Gemmataceae bacterium]